MKMKNLMKKGLRNVLLMFLALAWSGLACVVVPASGADSGLADAAIVDVQAHDLAYTGDQVLADAATSDAGQAGDAQLADTSQPLDAGSGQDSAASGDAGSALLGRDGGTVNLLKFAVFGDCRPHYINDDNGYPSDIVQQLFTQLSQRQPQFVLGVGDWMFATSYDHAHTQLQSLLSAEAPYAGLIFHAMGNHECNGYTRSNCPNLDETGEVRAYKELLWNFTDKAYYSFNVQTAHGLAKFVIVAPNAWTEEQSTWLTEVMNQPSDYTFVLRHEPSDATNAPGVTPSETIIKSHDDNTLIMYGHEHYYEHVSDNEVISGNGGAPLYDNDTGTGHWFGYLMVEQQDDGSILVEEHKKDTDEVMDSFRLSADGHVQP